MRTREVHGLMDVPAGLWAHRLSRVAGLGGPSFGAGLPMYC